ncbi:hypothetical protein BP00DRAFT_456850 [Aspergillus indologenus CBS 114.80]|uniref:Uncharacterized protein n=1 Tax=Aspergillus indologenus CBS 114.80 TaxID=1450541 RepID=A0A2V5IBZ2_9EURO|nr:hypothetical protein BP00DRAFT_456850 [Aspergillus indologenus CBS 114.80]
MDSAVARSVAQGALLSPVSQGSDISRSLTTASRPRSPSTLTPRELEKSFRALSCHHRKLQQKHADLMKAHQEKDEEITRLNAKVCALESELYLTRLAYSDDLAVDPLQTSLNQYDIRPTREAISCDVALSAPEPC